MMSIVHVVESQMDNERQTQAIQIAGAAFERNGPEVMDLKQIACEIKQNFDRIYPGSGKATEGVYHCIVGSSFASEGFLRENVSIEV